MNFDRVSSTLTLVANIGVVVGLFALIAELDHSSRLSEASAYQSRMTERQTVAVEVALSEELAALLEKHESEGIVSLDPVELRRVRAWRRGVILRMQGQYYQYQMGFLDRLSIDETLTAIVDENYQQWQELGILGTIEIPEWREEILQRLESQ